MGVWEPNISKNYLFVEYACPLGCLPKLIGKFTNLHKIITSVDNLYDVEVAAIDMCGRMSGFSEVAGLNLEGEFVSIHAYIHHSRMTSMHTTNTFVVHIAYNYNKQWPWDGYYNVSCMYVRKLCVNYS